METGSSFSVIRNGDTINADSAEMLFRPGQVHNSFVSKQGETPMTAFHVKFIQ